MTLAVLPVANATLINADCETGTAEVSLTGSNGAGNSSTVLPGWTYKANATPIGNFKGGTNVRSWNQRPGGGSAVGNMWHSNPNNSKTLEVWQVATGLTPGADYELKVWVQSVLVSGQGGAAITLALQNPTTSASVWGDTIGDDVPERGIWVHSAVTQTADVNGELKVRIYGALGGGSWSKNTPNAMFDDVTLTLVPEPASLVLLGFGCLFLARRRRPDQQRLPGC